jgi:hypothetical protein
MPAFDPLRTFGDYEPDLPVGTSFGSPAGSHVFRLALAASEAAKTALPRAMIRETEPASAQRLPSTQAEPPEPDGPSYNAVTAELWSKKMTASNCSGRRAWM